MDDVLEIECSSCCTRFHLDSRYSYAECAICDPRVPHPLDEEDFERRAEVIYQSQHSEILLERLFDKLELSEELPPLNCDGCYRDFMHKPEVLEYKGEKFFFHSRKCRSQFNPLHFVPRNLRKQLVIDHLVLVTRHTRQ